MRPVAGDVDVVALRLADLPPGAMWRVAAAGRWVCVGNDDGRLFAIADTCLHKGASLSGGVLRDGHLTCPGHWWRYDVHTGGLAEHPGTATVVFDVRVQDGDVVVTVPPAEPRLSWRETLLCHARVVKGVIWDVGGIVYPTPFEVFGEIEQARGLPSGTLHRGPFSPRGDELYDKVDAGDLPEPDYWRIRQAEWQAAGADVDVHRDIDWAGRERPAVVELLQRLGPRLPQLVLTNDATAFMGAGWRSTWSLRHHFKGLVDSVDLGVRKPDPQAYIAAADALELPKAACLFVDDLTVNVDAARAAGLQAVRFDVRDVPGSIARIEGLAGLA
ncbi:MAG: HAD-IA family hydrolase [Actinomycetota bacterium]|nr:HAD-IA family hydrolase [Actinomycetota bacterium]